MYHRVKACIYIYNTLKIYNIIYQYILHTNKSIFVILLVFKGKKVCFGVIYVVVVVYFTYTCINLAGWFYPKATSNWGIQ